MTDRLSDQEVSELIQIVELKHIKKREAHWYTLGIPVNHYYSLDDQLNAIKVLGESKSPKALEYISNLNLNKQVDNGVNTDEDGGGRARFDTIYPYAPVRLEEVLEIRMIFPSLEYTIHPRGDEAREILDNAMNRLQKETP